MVINCIRPLLGNSPCLLFIYCVVITHVKSIHAFTLSLSTSSVMTLVMTSIMTSVYAAHLRQSRPPMRCIHQWQSEKKMFLDRKSATCYFESFPEEFCEMIYEERLKNSSLAASNVSEFVNTKHKHSVKGKKAKGSTCCSTSQQSRLVARSALQSHKWQLIGMS